MKPLFCCAAMLLLAAGCRTNPRQELIEQEHRFLEDKIWQLSGLIDEYEQQLDSCQRENEALLRELGDLRSPNRRRPASRNDKLAPPVVEDVEAGSFEPPVIAPPDPSIPEGIAPGEGDFEIVEADEPASGPTIGRADAGLANRRLSAHGQSEPQDEVVTQITLNRKLTGGHNVDAKPGDEGVMVVVEPLNNAGELIEVPGAVSIVVLDPALEGEAARVARWDFSSREAAGHLKRTPLGDGLHFDLRWPHSPPTHRLLNLYVRYTTADGRRLQVEKQIDIEPPGAEHSGERWTRTPQPDLAADDASGETAGEHKSAPRARARSVNVLPSESTDGAATDEAARRTPARNTSRGASRASGPHWSPYR
ncbi:MAG TPA: hypothetical protein VFW87_11075 [Pirellulales bacterium]|nr:hypothetical protein [Pirellulales bacterium]